MNIRSLSVALMCFVLASAAQAQSIKNAIPDVARPLPLTATRVTGGPLKRAQDLNAEYLLKLGPDRMIAYYRKRAGLEPKPQGYPGWDGDGRNLTVDLMFPFATSTYRGKILLANATRLRFR